MKTIEILHGPKYLDSSTPDACGGICTSVTHNLEFRLDWTSDPNGTEFKAATRTIYWFPDESLTMMEDGKKEYNNPGIFLIHELLHVEFRIKHWDPEKTLAHNLVAESIWIINKENRVREQTNKERKLSGRLFLKPRSGADHGYHPLNTDEADPSSIINLPSDLLGIYNTPFTGWRPQKKY
jgi:hypothetical protein